MATGDIGTPQWQISGTPEWQAETDLVHVSGKLQVAPYEKSVSFQQPSRGKMQFPIPSLLNPRQLD